jgi:intracellular sulfur oxidation DsrE/DsrF family protein
MYIVHMWLLSCVADEIAPLCLLSGHLRGKGIKEAVCCSSLEEGRIARQSCLQNFVVVFNGITV